MGKPPSGEKNGLKKGPWTPEEDQKLIDYIRKYGHGKWRTLPKNAGLKRCGKSCRLRWTNYLRPDIKRGRFSLEEEEAIIQLHSVLGNKWSTIAANLPGRTDNEIKNYWNTHIKKRLLRMGIDPVTHTPCLDMLQLSSLLNSSLLNSSQLNCTGGLFGMGNMVNPSLITAFLTALLSSENRNNPEIANQVFQRNQLSKSSILVQNPCQSSDQPIQLNNSLQSFQPNNPQVPIQENQYSCALSNALNMESQLKKEKTDQFSPNSTNFSHQNNPPYLWQYNEQPESAATGNFSSPKLNSIMNSQLENHISHESHNINDQCLPNFSFINSLLSTAPSSSSPSTLNSPSSTTFVNGATEDERDTYCSNMLMYNMSSSGLNGLNGLL